MKKIKVAYIISDINKSLSFEWIALQLNKEKFELQFVLLNPAESELEAFLIKNHIPCTTVKCSGKKDWAKVIVMLTRLLRKEKPAIVHCHLLTASILGLLAARISGVKARIYTRHHSDYHFRYFPKGVKWDKFCNRLATKIIAPSIAVKEILVSRENVPDQKVEVINHGFDLNYFKTVAPESVARIKEKFNPSAKYPVIGVISRFTELKGIQYIIPAFRKLLSDFPDALLLLFNAQGDYSAQIDLLLAELPDGSYLKVPFENDLAAVYRLFDVFVQASTDTNIESFGQTYIEALASGIPSVFTLAGIAPDFVIHEENALVVPFRDMEALYASMKRILNNKELKDKIIKQGWKSIEYRFSLHEMIKQLTHLYTNS